MVSVNAPTTRRRRQKSEPTTVTPFGSLAESVVNELERISFPIHFPDGTTLFSEGEIARGIFVIQDGRVKIFLSSGDGRTLILRMAGAGDVVGLAGTLAGKPYQVTAQTQGPCQVAYIKREPFLRLMDVHKEIGIGVAHQLTRMYLSACHEVRCLGLSHTSGEKLATLLLGWPMNKGDTASRIRFPFRHEEVAQMIGTSRETVSRLFIEFKKQKLAQLDGVTLHIRDRQLLQLVADGKTLICFGPKSGNLDLTRVSPQHVADSSSIEDFYSDSV